VIEDHPKWIPNNFGNKKHSSLATTSPTSTSNPRARATSTPRAHSTGRIALNFMRNDQSGGLDDEYYPDKSGDNGLQTSGSHQYQHHHQEQQHRAKSPAAASTVTSRTPNRLTAKKAEYDVLASRAAPNRSKSATANPSSRSQHNVFHAHQSPRSGRNAVSDARASSPPRSHQTQRDSRDGAIMPGAGDPAGHSAPLGRERRAGPALTKSMSDMTVSEIRAALLSMPAMVRESLMDTPQGSRPASTRPTTRRGSYEESPAYTPSANNLSHNTHASHSMQEEYFNSSRRRNSEQYDRFMGDGYPAVGEFYPADPYGQPEESSAEEEEEVGMEEESGSDDVHGAGLRYDVRAAERGREHDRRRFEYTAQQEYRAHREAPSAAEDSDYPQEYGHRIPALDEERADDGRYEESEYSGEERYEEKRPLRTNQSSAPRHVFGAPFRSVPLYAEHSDGEERKRHVKSKAKLPEAAKRSNIATKSSHQSDQRQDDASDRESLIPRRVDVSPRPGSSLRRIDTGNYQSDGYDSSVSPAAKSKSGARAASAQRVPARSHKHTRAGAGADAPFDGPAKAPVPNRAASTGSATERTRYLPEGERKQALDWSRKQAYDKKVRANFSGSPLRAASPAAIPSALKLKYRSFNNSVEKDFTSSVEIDAAGAKQSLPSRNGAPKALVNAESRHPASALEKGAAVQEAMGAIARSRARAHLDEQNTGKSKNKSDHVAYSANAFSKKPENFFAFRSHHRAGGNLPPSTQDSSQHKELPAARKVSPAAKARPFHVDSPAVAADSFIRSNQQMLAGYQSRESPERTERAPIAARRDEQTMTNVAEWRRLTEWLARIGMQRYIEVLRANGVTKLSLVELMQPEDMQQIGIAPADIEVIHSKVTEFTNRTRSFSEQVLNRGSKSPSPSPPTSHTGSASYHAPLPDPVDVATLGAMARPVVRRPNAPPPHHFAKHGKEKLPAPFVQHGGAGATQNSNVPFENDRSEEETGGTQREEVLESARVAAEEHIFSDVGEIRAELLRCFEAGERELFFHAWKQATLYMPDDCNALNPQRPSMYNAKQVIEFHLHLHFAVFPITHAQGKKAEKQGKLALRRYLESIMLTSELDSLNQLHELSPRPALSSEKLASPRSDEGHLFLETNLLNMTSGSIASPSTPFTRTREYAVYAGMVLVPDPQENVAFQALFQPQWMQSLKERLGQFLTLVSPNIEIVTTVSTATNSVANAADTVPAAVDRPDDVAKESDAISDDGSRAAPSVHSVHSRVRNYLEPALAATPAPSQGRLDDFEIAFTSPINARHGDPGSPPLEDIRVEAIDLSSPLDLHITTNMLEDVVSPLEMSPSEADVPRKRMASTKLSDEAMTMAKLTRIASPVSAVSSVISQLTDDDFPRSTVAAAALRADALHGAAPVATVGKPGPVKKLRLKPFSATQKSAMQSQVDMYNKLLKHGAGSSDENQVGVDEPQHEGTQETPSDSSPVFRTTRRTTSNTTNQPKAPAFNVGFGLKRRTSSDAPVPDQQQSLAAQVARYNKLLTSTAPDTAAAASGLDADTNSFVENGAIPVELPAGQSQDTAEEISAAEAERVEEVLLEMQNIYISSAESPIQPASDGDAPPDGLFSDAVGQKIELHEQAAQPRQELDIVEVHELQRSGEEAE